MMNDTSGDFPSFTDDTVFPAGTEELNLILKDENLFQMESLHSEVHPQMNQSYPECPYLSVPDTTYISSNVPYPTSKLPAMEDYPGPFDFHMDMNKPRGDKGKWKYSKALNKMFVMMGCKVPLMFKWNQLELGLFVRALPVFLDQDYFEEPVHRCASHVSILEKSNEGFHFVDHVVRCENINTVYDMNHESKRLSVVVPLDHPQPGADGTTIVYSFMCKNSCSLGMSCRTTGLIFTLEHENGEVVGRRMVKLRICSCPRRDLLKEEKDLTVKKTKTEDVSSTYKKPLKRLSNNKEAINFQIRIPESMAHFAFLIANLIKEAIMLRPYHKLTAAEKTA